MNGPDWYTHEHGSEPSDLVGMREGAGVLAMCLQVIRRKNVRLEVRSCGASSCCEGLYWFEDVPYEPSEAQLKSTVRRADGSSVLLGEATLEDLSWTNDEERR